MGGEEGLGGRGGRGRGLLVVSEEIMCDKKRDAFFEFPSLASSTTLRKANGSSLENAGSEAVGCALLTLLLFLSRLFTGRVNRRGSGRIRATRPDPVQPGP